MTVSVSRINYVVTFSKQTFSDEARRVQADGVPYLFDDVGTYN